jgi:alkylresorcinol/alkylpyrone synthase
MYISSVEIAHPPHYYDQSALLEEFEKLWSKQHHNTRRVSQLHKAVMVGGRHLALPIEDYHKLKDFTDSNNAFISVGTDLAEEAVRKALNTSGLSPRDVDAVFFVSVTGIATPSIDAKLVNRLGMRSDVKRIPIFGLGCVAGAAGTARLYDYLKAYPNDTAILISVELCSLTLQRKDLSIPNLIASGLFGDGAACVVGVGNERAKKLNITGPQVISTQSRFYPNTESVMGWEIGADGFKIVLESRVPELAQNHLRQDVDKFLEGNDLKRTLIDWWVCHTGGPKVLKAFQSALEISELELAISWSSLKGFGNLSSASVLFVLHETMKVRKPQTGEYGLMLAMGPGFCCEMVLLKW